jgi:hypothetical protein
LNTPAEWNPEGAPTEVRGGLDILAARTGVNLSQSIAYVSNTGLNPGITPELGNPLKPFATIEDAANALPNSNAYLKVFPGTYPFSTTPGYQIAAKTDWIIDIQGCEITNEIVVVTSTNVLINAKNAKITDTTS